MPPTETASEELGKRLQDALVRAVGLTASNMAVQDFCVLGFLSYMWLRVWVAPESPAATIARSGAFGLLVTALLVLLMTRGAILGPGPARAAVYRLGMLGPVVGSYFVLKWLLPALQPRLLDVELLRLDEALFGYTPAHILDVWVSRGSVEWFSFFYYSYFYVLGLFILGSLVFDRGVRLQEMAFGSMVVVAVGHCVYTIVPGLGPYVDYPFQNELVGGFWWAQVTSAVSTAGAQMDIFPSLHTAFPVFFALHAYRYRGQSPFKWGWLPTVFVAANIVIATLFLRWHYGVDVMGGVCLALFAQRTAIAAANYELRRGTRSGRQEVFEPLQ